MCKGTCADRGKKDEIFFAKVKEGATIPSKRDEDGCYDVYACFEEGVDMRIIKPGEVKLIPTGIASACDKKYRFGGRERGSTGTKCMAFRAGQIDSGYRGEWFVPINNTGNKTIIIRKGIKESFEEDDVIYYPASKAIASIALEFVPDVDVKEVTYEELQAMTSERGVTCLGQSGK